MVSLLKIGLKVMTKTIKGRVLRYNLIVIVALIILTSIIFNMSIRWYLKQDMIDQLERIATLTEYEIFRPAPNIPGLWMLPDARGSRPNLDIELIRYYLMLERSLREPLTLLNANYILIDRNMNRVALFPDDFFQEVTPSTAQVLAEVTKLTDFSGETYLDFSVAGQEYIALVKPIENRLTNLGWLIIFSPIGKIQQIQLSINLILFAILLFTSLIAMLISSLLTKKITTPFSILTKHIRGIAERNFGEKIELPVYQELEELVSSINLMSEKLASYDQAEKTFFQNVSHELRTPLMSMQSYAEGIQHSLVEPTVAANIIVEESHRMAQLIEELLYLSRLDTIEENFNMQDVSVNDFLASCVERCYGAAISQQVTLEVNYLPEDQTIVIDPTKLIRAFTNIITNCLRYADTVVQISAAVEDNHLVIRIADDGSGFEEHEIENLFNRFYKGKKGSFGLGLAISKNLVLRHKGTISACNTDSGALFTITLPLPDKNTTV